MFRQPVAYPVGGAGTREMSHFLTMVEQHDSGKAPQCVAPREFHILALVNLHFDHQHFAIELVYGAADMRRYGMAWSAPVCPEVHHHRLTLRCLDYLFPEIVQSCFGDPLALLQLVLLANRMILSSCAHPALISMLDAIQLPDRRRRSITGEATQCLPVNPVVHQQEHPANEL